MEKISFDLSKYQQPKKAPTYYWQQLALDCLEYLEQPRKSQVFKWAKTRESKLKSALNYMKTRNITSFRYLAALMSR